MQSIVGSNDRDAGGLKTSNFTENFLNCPPCFAGAESIQQELMGEEVAENGGSFVEGRSDGRRASRAAGGMHLAETNDCYKNVRNPKGCVHI
jgi:hypothetical protein